MTTKLNQLVRCPDGEVTTISKLADKGLVVFTKSDNFVGRGGKEMTKYFADFVDGSGCFEIGKTAYLSRTNQEISFDTKE